jgi:hypothetical protein
VSSVFARFTGTWMLEIAMVWDFSIRRPHPPPT